MASKPVYADSAFLYALVDQRDSAHASAVESLRKLVNAQRPVITSDYVLTESLTLAKARAGPVAAIRLLDRLETTDIVNVEWIGPQRFQSAKAYFRKHTDHGYSFTDCTSFVVMHELGITDALTTDRHFIEAGFKVLLPVTTR